MPMQSSRPPWHGPCPKPVAIRDKGHLRFIRSLPCIVCGISPCDAAHISLGNNTKGMGRKTDDCYTVPLCHKHHMEQHSIPEREWWQKFGFDDPNELALLLYKHTGNIYKCRVLIAATRAIARNEIIRAPLWKVVSDV